MTDAEARKRAFEARLSALKQKMEQGLSTRATDLREAARALDEGDVGARQTLKSHAHRLRGIAGTYGHPDLTDAATRLEQTAAVSPAAQVVELAEALADMAEQVGKRSKPVLSSPAPAMAPQSRATSTSEAEPASRTKPTGQKSLRILAVDDDPLTVRLLTLTLRDVGGFDATIVNSAAEGLAKLRAERFDLVISDAMMPDMDGKEFCAAARALGGAAATIPILILSAATADELGWTGEARHHTGWLRKPFRPSELVRKLNRYG